MQTIFVLVKCKLGKVYDVAAEAVDSVVDMPSTKLRMAMIIPMTAFDPMRTFSSNPFTLKYCFKVGF